MTGPANTGTEGQAAGGTSGAGGQTSTAQTTDGKTDLATLPADVQNLITSLRAEAKGHREAKETAESRVKELEGEVETAQAASRTLSEEAQKASRALTLRNLRDKFGLDEKAEKFLTAETAEELEAQAEALSTFVKPPENNGTGDQGQNDGQGTGGGARRVTDPAQQGQETVDEDAARAQAFFAGN